MKKRLLSLLFFGTYLMAEVTNLPATIDFVESKKMKIIDIRTKSEWKQMGVVHGAHCITFFDEVTKDNKAKYDINKFLKSLNKVVNKDEQFAIICNTASRTKLVSFFLGKKMDYNVVNLTGGMTKLIKDGYSVDKYDPQSRTKVALAKKEKSVKKNELLERSTTLKALDTNLTKEESK